LFEEISSFAEQSVAISPWLPVIIKTAFISMITLVTLVPLMFIAWLVHWASSPALMSAIRKFDSLALQASSLARKMFDRGSQSFHYLSSTNSLYIPLDEPNEVNRVTELVELDSAIERLQDKIDRAPDLAANTEATKQQTLDDLIENLDGLSRARDQLIMPSIPKISEEDATAKLRKSEAFSALIVFLPLTALVIAINTALLNVFFSEMFDGKEIFGLPYSILISFIFSVIEAGIGVMLGGTTSSGGKKSYLDATKAICYFIVLCLTMIELALYFLVGTYNIGGLELEDALDMIVNGELILVFVQGAWFMLIGPVVVLSLYLFGHRLAEAYFEFKRYNHFDAFRNAMDKGYQLSESFLENIRDGESRSIELVAKIKDEDISLNQLHNELPDKVEEYKNILAEEVSGVGETIEKARKLEVKMPEIRAQKIGPEQSEEILKLSGAYLLLFILAIIMGAWVFPAANIPFLPDFSLSTLLLSCFIALACLIAGVSIQHRVAVVRTNDSEVARLIINKRGWMAKTGVILAAIGLAVFYWYVFDGVKFSELRASIAVVINVACLYVGTQLLVSLAGWASLTRWFMSSVVGLFFVLCQFLASLISNALEFINSLLHVFSTPAKTVFGYNT